MKSLSPILTALFILAWVGCSTQEKPRDITAVLFPSKQVLHDFFTAVDLDEKTGEWIDVKTVFHPPEDRQIALVVKLDQERVDSNAEIFYEVVSPGNFVVEVERQTYKMDVPTGVFFSIDELVKHGKSEEKSGYGTWTGNFYVDGIILGQVKFEIVNPNPEEEETESLEDELFPAEEIIGNETAALGENLPLENTSITPVQPAP